MEIIGSHKVSFEMIKALAIECHALDLSAYHLLFDGTHSDISGATKDIYEGLITSKLLSLAIAVRTKLYQKVDTNTSSFNNSHCGLLYKTKNNIEESISFTIKDVCDKIIHADTVSKHLEKGVEKPTISLKGKDQGKNEWELSISVSLFCESILNWVQEIE
jgi:hypothetical protein